MIIGSSKGKLISNNISRSQAITETLGKRLDSTAENTKKQVQRQGSNTATDRDTKKVLRNTERVATPLVAAAMTSHMRHQIQFYQNAADKYVEKHNLGNDRTATFNKMGMAARSYGDQPDTFGTVRKEINANMDEQYTVNAETIQRMKYQDGKRVPSAKNTVATIEFQEDGSGVAISKCYVCLVKMIDTKRGAALAPLNFCILNAYVSNSILLVLVSHLLTGLRELIPNYLEFEVSNTHLSICHSMEMAVVSLL